MSTTLARIRAGTFLLAGCSGSGGAATSAPDGAATQPAPADSAAPAPAESVAAASADTGSASAVDACALAAKEPTFAYAVLRGSLADPAKNPEPVASESGGQSVCTWTGETGTMTLTVDSRPEAMSAFAAAKAQLGDKALALRLGPEDSYVTTDTTAGTYTANATLRGTVLYLSWTLSPAYNKGAAGDATGAITTLSDAMRTLIRVMLNP